MSRLDSEQQLGHELHCIRLDRAEEHRADVHFLAGFDPAIDFVADAEFTITLDMGFGRLDTNLPGNSNKGHTHGAALSEEEQAAVLEYLKTL